LCARRVANGILHLNCKATLSCSNKKKRKEKRKRKIKMKEKRKSRGRTRCFWGCPCLAATRWFGPAQTRCFALSNFPVAQAQALSLSALSLSELSCILRKLASLGGTKKNERESAIPAHPGTQFR